MNAYRDQYASLFHGGQNVVLIGISNDSQEELRSWLKDADYPFLFASDQAHQGATYQAYGGGLRDTGNIDSRTVIVVGPDGRITGVIPQFNQVDPQAYEELQAMIDAVTPEPES
ncbi:MAG: redoxin domain-containing protein [Gemmatimonadota bacterium]